MLIVLSSCISAVFGFAVGMIFMCSVTLGKRNETVDAEYMDIDENL